MKLYICECFAVVGGAKFIASGIALRTYQEHCTLLGAPPLFLMMPAFLSLLKLSFSFLNFIPLFSVNSI